MHIVSNPMQEGGRNFEGGGGSGGEQSGDSLKMCLKGSFETQLGSRNGHSEEETGRVGKEGEMKISKEMKEQESNVGKEEEMKEKDEMKEEMVENLKGEMKEKEDMKEEKMFADSCVQTGPPSFRMVRFKQEAAGVVR